MADDTAQVIITAQVEEALAGINSVKESIVGLTEPVNAIKEAFSGVGEAIAGAFAVEKISEFFNQLEEAATRVENLHQILGISTEQIGQLQGIAEASGISVDRLALSMERFQLNLEKAVNGGINPTYQGLKAVGLSAKELIDLPMDQQISKMAEAFARLEPGPARTAAAMAMVRGGAEALLPILAKGADALAEFGAAATRAEVNLGANIAALERAHVAHTELNLAVTGLSQAVGGVLAPAWTKLTEEISHAIEAFTQAINIGGSLRSMFTALNGAIIDIIADVIKAGASVMELGVSFETMLNNTNTRAQAFGRELQQIFIAIANGAAAAFAAIEAAGINAAKAIGTAFTDAGQAIKLALSFDFAGAKAALSDIGNTGARVGEAITGGMKGVKEAFDFSQVGTNFAKVQQDLADTSAVGASRIIAIQKSMEDELSSLYTQGNAKELAAATAHAGQMQLAKQAGHKKAKDDSAKANQEELDGDIKALQQNLKNTEKAIDDKLKLHQISDSQRAVMMRDAVDDEYNDEYDLLTKEMALWGEGTKQYEKALARRKELEQKYAGEIQDIDFKLAEAQQKSWDNVAKTIESAINGQLRGILQGTTTWKQAMSNIFLDLTTKILESIEKWVIEWIVGEARTVTAQVTGDAAKVASTESTAAASTAASATGFLSTIMKDAAQTFAGVFAFLSPVMGPAAAGPAAGAEATVAAVAGADQGIWDVPGNIIRQLHAGESVVPQTFAQGMRSSIGGDGNMGGGQGLTVNFNVTSIDAPGVKQFFKNYGKEITHTINQQMRLNPSSRQGF